MKKMIAGLSLLGTVGFGFMASAGTSWIGGDTTTKVYVSNDNKAEIYTQATSTASTGGNTADATSTSNKGSADSIGGQITTGNASATTNVVVAANDNTTDITLGSSCGCPTVAPTADTVLMGDNTTLVGVHNSNWAKILTDASSYAKTGYNSVDSMATSNAGDTRAVGGDIHTGSATALTGVGVITNANWTKLMVP